MQGNYRLMITVFLIYFFITYVRLILDYSSPIWSPTSSTGISVIERVQPCMT